MEYSKISSVELRNFMSFRKAKIVFDETGIINIKGYNDSGKSAILRGLAVCLMDMFKSKQVKFIRDDEDYFRIVVTFEDGVSILRDKYRNGQSLYEMYKDDELVFTTRQGNKLSKVSKVPDVIEKYLGLCVTDSVYLNYQSCVDRLPVVDTNGSENYQMFHEVLRMVEIHRANTMLNSDKNELGSRIAVIENDIAKEEVLLNRCSNIDENLIDALKQSQVVYEEVENRKSDIGGIVESLDNYSKIPLIPSISKLDTSQIEDLQSLNNILNTLDSVPKIPELHKVDLGRLETILNIGKQFSECDKPTIPFIPKVDSSRLEMLGKLYDMAMSNEDYVYMPNIPRVDEGEATRLSVLGKVIEVYRGYNNSNKACQKIDNELDLVKSKLAELVSKAEEQGISFVKCRNCGTYSIVGEEHTHE